MTCVQVYAYEFKDKELIEELESRGYSCIKHGVSLIYQSLDGSDLERIEHLAACGHTGAAKTELLAMVSQVIGRDLTH